MARKLTTSEEAVYKALLTAAERIGHNAYKAGLYNVRRNRKGTVVRGYTLTPEHQEVMTAIDALGRGTISAEEAMSILHEHDVIAARILGYRAKK